VGYFVSVSEEQTSEFEHRLGGQLLESVSRSFYLSLKFLPSDLRGPVSLAYLLARASDTLADAEGVDPSLRMALLDEFADLVRPDSEGVADKQVDGLASRVMTEVAGGLGDSGERALMSEIGAVLRWLTVLPRAQSLLIRQVLEPIAKGQRLDVARFSAVEAAGCGVACIPDASCLDEYTYQVAGCVGAFWTDICILQAPPFSRSLGHEEMRLRGIRLGRGLQLINVIRDFPRDLAGGRCYLPAEQIREAGMDPDDADLRARGSELWSLWRPWMLRCRQHLDAGLEYLLDVKPRRLLVATGLPLMLAARTLARLEQAEWSELESGVKVSRSEVAGLVKELGLATVARGRLEKIYRAS
jgi:farnesyl-diphosphate farnesyltransferase